MKLVYVDNNATTQPDPEVVDAILPFLKEHWGNPSSMHTFGGVVAKDVDKARESAANLVGANPNEIILTSCGTESDNAAIHSALAVNPSKRRIITTSVEHPAVLEPAKALAKKGCDVVFLPVDGLGRLNLSDLEKNLDDNVALVSIMWANNETGVVFPIEDIAAMCASKKIPLHVDAVQAAGKLPINLKKLQVNFLAISGHKLHAPKGVGALYIRKGTPFAPFMVGGHQERGRRAGTENVASIVGFGKACELALEHVGDGAAKIGRLRDKLEKKIIESISKTFIHGDTKNRLPNTTNIGFEGIEGEAILLLLNEFGICASSGSACTSGSLDPSHVMMAMGVPFSRAHGSIRFSLSRYNTEEEIDYILEKLPGIVKRLRDLSPVG